MNRSATALFLVIAATACASARVTEGTLYSVDPDGRLRGTCPLKHTDVKAEISGPLARVTVRQEFGNASNEKIEAVYTFPLPRNAAVDDMTLVVGDRVVKGIIKRREEARALYEAARASGRVASLLDQERANIFTQHVANIMPGEKISVTISYVETVKYEDGFYEFAFPMVVGPRYIPGSKATGRQGGGWAPDTDRVPDASRITPPVTPSGTRAGHDISLEVAIDAGVPVGSVQSKSHEIDIVRPSVHQATATLRDKTTIPNKDFLLRYDVAGRRIEDAVLTTRANGKGFFTLVLTPPERVGAADVLPKELVFVLDTSGSMSGFPIEKAKEAMKLALDGLYPQDTFNLITFSGDTRILFPEPVPATAANLARAREFLASHHGSGGTEMMKAIRAALAPSDHQDHLRIVCFMTDGYVGNDMEIIAEIQRHANARVFAFGIGSSANRFLLDKMAEQGRGEVEYVGLNDDGSAAARRFHERVRSPLLTDISIDWGGLPVADVYPRRIPDLFAAKPLVLTGRYTAPAQGTITLRGHTAGQGFSRAVNVVLPAAEPKHEVLGGLWARTRIDHLMAQDYDGAQNGSFREDLREAIVSLGLEFRLMTQFTSFVAVEEMTVTEGGQPKRVQVPVEMPEGVSHEGIFGSGESRAMPMALRLGGGGGGGGVVGGVLNATMQMKSAAPPPPPSRAARAYDMAAPMPVSKLDPALAKVVERLKNPARKPDPAEAKFVRDGKAAVQIWLTDTSPAALAQLKRLGFELLLKPESANLVLGRLPVEKLEALSGLSIVRYVAPRI